MDKSNAQQIPPSSPPLPPSSPSLPVLAPAAKILRPRRRIQPIRHHSGSSSDAPFFSSDDLDDASKRHYESPRQKRQYKRKWWEAELENCAVTHTEMRQATRIPKDSGIFVASDSGSDASSGDGFNVACLKLVSSPKRNAKMDAFSSPYTSPQSKQQPLRGDALVKKVVHECLESGEQVVNLDRCHLTSISPGALRPLQHLIREPKFISRPATEQAFHSLTPSIELILSSNGLRELPSEIFQLKYLSMLSLRNNKLTELSPAVGGLTNLTELNVSSNRLRWLPWELLSLISGPGHLQRLSVLNNNYFRPTQITPPAGYTFASEQSEVNRILEDLHSMHVQAAAANETEIAAHFRRLMLIQHELSRRMHILGTSEPRRLQRTRSRPSPSLEWKRDPIYLGRTEPSFIAFCGTVLRDSPPPPSNLAPEVDVQLILDSSYKLRSHPCYATIKQERQFVPSLFETCLRACVAEGVVDDATALVPFDASINVHRGLEKARAIASQGGRKCSVCACEYVMPRAEWIEYWHCSPETLFCAGDEVALPFLRQTCSWACALDVWMGTI